MHNRSLAADSVHRAAVGLEALKVLFATENHELAFHGAEDLTPSDFYRREDAEHAFATARSVVERVQSFVPGGE